MVEGDALHEQVAQRVVLRELLERRAVVAQVEVEDVPHGGRVGRVEQRAVDLGRVLLAALAREHEEERGQQPLALEVAHGLVQLVREGEHLGLLAAVRGLGLGDEGLALLARARGRDLLLQDLGVLARGRARLEPVAVDLVLEAVRLGRDDAHVARARVEHAVLERHDAVRRREERAAHLPHVREPVVERRGRRHRCREQHDLHAPRQQDERLLPRVPALGVEHVVRLVEDDGREPLEREVRRHARRGRRRADLEEPVAQNLLREHDDLRVRRKLYITC